MPGGASDDDCGRQRQDSPAADQLPPAFLDLGGGEAFGIGTADDFAAAAEWLRRHYPGAPQRNRVGPPLETRIFNMGHELTREARAGMPRGWSMGQRAVVLVLADICNDRTRRQPPHMDVSERLCEELDITPGTLGNILSRLAAAGFEFRIVVGKDRRDKPIFAHRGHAVDYQFPHMPPRTPKGPSVDGSIPVDNSPKGPLFDGAITNEDPSAGGALAAKAHPSMAKGPSVDGPQTPKTPNSQRTTPSLSRSERAGDSEPGDERETDDFDDDEPDPDAVLLAEAVPGADWLDIEWAITSLRQRKHYGEIKITVRGYLRAIIKNGDARSLVDEAAAERRRGLAELARNGADPFGAPEPRNTVTGYVVDSNPGWCGKCERFTHMREDDQGRPYRCPECHPGEIRTRGSRLTLPPAEKRPGEPPAVVNGTVLQTGEGLETFRTALAGMKEDSGTAERTPTA